MNFKLLRFASVSILALGTVALACGAQVGPSHQGDALATIRGQVVSVGQPTSQPAAAALAWLSFDPAATSIGTLRLVGTSVPVTGDFPLGFEMDVYLPPPASALLPLGDPIPGGFPLDPSKPAETGVAAVIALASTADHENVKPADILGTSLDLLVVYNSHPIAPESPSAKLLSGLHAPLTAGYHLISVQQPTAEQHAGFVRCTTGGVCVQTHFDPGTSEFVMAKSDADYADCIAASPNATSCNLWATAAPAPEQQQETSACIDLASMHQGKDCSNGRTFAETVGVGAATVTLGTTPWKVWR